MTRRNAPKLVRIAATLADNVAGYTGSERADVRIAADFIHDAIAALNKGDLDKFITRVGLAGSFIGKVPYPSTVARRRA